MIRKIAVAGAVACLGAVSLFGDFSYEQTSKITGGMMAGAMKVMGVFSKQAREPMRSTVLLKGDRMAQVQADSAQIIDLGSETITHIDYKKKQFSVVTFEQMKQFLQKMSEQMEAKRKEGAEGEKVNLDFKVDVKDTGQKKQIAGMDTHEVIMTVEMEGTDPSTGQTGAMEMSMDTWMAPSVPGYEEVRDFYKRMAQKVNWVPNGFGGLNARSAANAKGMAALYEQAAKLDGVPVFQVTKMGLKGEGGAPTSGSGSQAGSKQQPSPSVTEALGRSLGGFGRFGRRKKKEEPKEEAPPAQPSGDASGALMEMTTEYTGFSSAPVDPSKLDTTPAGFKQVESEIEKALRK